MGKLTRTQKANTAAARERHQHSLRPLHTLGDSLLHRQRKPVAAWLVGVGSRGRAAAAGSGGLPGPYARAGAGQGRLGRRGLREGGDAAAGAGAFQGHRGFAGRGRRGEEGRERASGGRGRERGGCCGRDLGACRGCSWECGQGGKGACEVCSMTRRWTRISNQ